MSYYATEEEDRPGGAMEIEAADEDPFTQCPTWIALSGISPQARALYWILAMHLNMRRVENGDREVWPSKESIAALMGLTKASAIDRYMGELVAIRAVEVFRRREGRMRTRNRYMIHRNAPKGWSGPKSIAEYYARRKAVAEAGAEKALVAP